MTRVAGIQFEKNTSMRTGYVRINLDKYANNEVLQDFLDGVEAEKILMTEDFTDAEFFFREENQRRMRLNT
jgi:hypothetical protein